MDGVRTTIAMKNPNRKELQSRQDPEVGTVGLDVKGHSLRDGKGVSLDIPFHKTWEPGLSLGLRQWVTRPIREFTSGDFTMYQNRITLIGFLGQDATTRTANNASFTVLSLATKSSYKDKKTGEYNGHTEWHRCIVWGKLTEYATTLKKGAHLAVEGELRSRETTDKKTNAKQRVWEVRVSSILKLDRAEKVSPEEQENTDFNPEEEAA
jgi:single-strand DNA-binding protein